MIKGFGPNSDMGYVHCALIAHPTPQKIKDPFLNFQTCRGALS